MRRLVALDTSTWWCGLALIEQSGSSADPRVVAEERLRVTDSHAAHLLPLLDRMMAGASWDPSSVDGYAAARGPGSFTGLRVGLGTVRGLALASGRPCLGVGTLEAMAEAFGPAEAERVPLLDAGRGEVYGARFDPGSSPPVELTAPWVGPPERALGPAAGPAVLFGPGAEAHRERLSTGSRKGRLGPSPTSIAAAVGRLALGLLDRCEGAGDAMSPIYLRPPDAEIKRAKH